MPSKTYIGILFPQLLLLALAACSEAKSPNKSKVKSKGSAKAQQQSAVKTGQFLSPFELSVHPKSCTIPQQVRVSSQIISKNYSEIRSPYFSTITKFLVQRGDLVKKGQLLATTDSSALDQMKRIFEDYLSLYGEQLVKAKKGQKVLSDRRDRLKGLLLKSIIPQSEYDEVDKQALAANDQVEKTERIIDSTKKSIESYTEQIRKANFYADIEGVVTDLIIDPRSMSGNLNVMPEALIVKIEQPGTYVAAAQMLDTQIHNIKMGMKSEITLPDNSILAGTVTYVSVLPVENKKSDNHTSFDTQDANQNSGVTTYKAIVEFKRPGPILPAGLLASVKIVTDEVKAETCLPWNAIELVGGVPHIRAFREGSGLQRFPVELGATGPQEVQILTALSSSSVVLAKLW